MVKFSFKAYHYSIIKILVNLGFTFKDFLSIMAKLINKSEYALNLQCHLFTLIIVCTIAPLTPTNI